jgi:hypothetical protein
MPAVLIVIRVALPLVHIESLSYSSAFQETVESVMFEIAELLVKYGDTAALLV